MVHIKHNVQGVCNLIVHLARRNGFSGADLVFAEHGLFPIPCILDGYTGCLRGTLDSIKTTFTSLESLTKRTERSIGVKVVVLQSL